MTAIIVTAFLDLGRSNWPVFGRCNEDYFSAFLKLLSSRDKVIAFIDASVLIPDLSKYLHLTVIPLTRELIEAELPFFQLIDAQQSIIDSVSYRALTAHRSSHPEHRFAVYNLLNHSKADFICLADRMGLIDPKMRPCWVDFGLLKPGWQVPRTKLGLDALPADQITLFLVSALDAERDLNLTETVANPVDVVHGAFLSGSCKAFRTLASLMWDEVNYMQRLQIVDDDQHVLVRLIHKHGSNFNAQLNGDWCNALTKLAL